MYSIHYSHGSPARTEPSDEEEGEREISKGGRLGRFVLWAKHLRKSATHRVAPGALCSRWSQSDYEEFMPSNRDW